jgi:hypothetical protein
MGTWGPGNFENDYAADRLYEVCGPLLAEIEQAMKKAPVDLEDDFEMVMANLEIVVCLSEHLGRYDRGEIQDFLYPCVLPSPETVSHWKQKFLEVWDVGVDPDPKSFDRERRRVIVDTLERAEWLACGRYKGKSHPDVRSCIVDQVQREGEEPDADQSTAVDRPRE